MAEPQLDDVTRPTEYDLAELINGGSMGGISWFAQDMASAIHDLTVRAPVDATIDYDNYTINLTRHDAGPDDPIVRVGRAFAGSDSDRLQTIRQVNGGRGYLVEFPADPDRAGHGMYGGDALERYLAQALDVPAPQGVTPERATAWYESMNAHLTTLTIQRRDRIRTDRGMHLFSPKVGVMNLESGLGITLDQFFKVCPGETQRYRFIAMMDSHDERNRNEEFAKAAASDPYWASKHWDDHDYWSEIEQDTRNVWPPEEKHLFNPWNDLKPNPIYVENRGYDLIRHWGDDKYSFSWQSPRYVVESIMRANDMDMLEHPKLFQSLLIRVTPFLEELDHSQSFTRGNFARHITDNEPLQPLDIEPGRDKWVEGLGDGYDPKGVIAMGWLPVDKTQMDRRIEVSRMMWSAQERFGDFAPGGFVSDAASMLVDLESKGVITIHPTPAEVGGVDITAANATPTTPMEKKETQRKWSRVRGAVIGFTPVEEPQGDRTIRLTATRGDMPGVDANDARIGIAVVKPDDLIPLGSYDQHPDAPDPSVANMDLIRERPERRGIGKWSWNEAAQQTVIENSDQLADTLLQDLHITPPEDRTVTPTRAAAWFQYAQERVNAYTTHNSPDGFTRFDGTPFQSDELTLHSTIGSLIGLDQFHKALPSTIQQDRYIGMMHDNITENTVNNWNDPAYWHDRAANALLAGDRGERKAHAALTTPERNAMPREERQPLFPDATGEELYQALHAGPVAAPAIEPAVMRGIDPGPVMYPDPANADPYMNPVDHAPDRSSPSIPQPMVSPSGPSLV